VSGYSRGVTRGIDAFLDFLKAEQLRGVTHVTLDAAARSALRALHERLRNPAARQSAAVAAVPVTSAGPMVTANAEPETVSVAAPASVDSGSGTNQERIARLRAQAANWPPALRLGTLREPMVFSTGNPDARLVLIGEAPGYEEEKQNEPFVGQAGKKLDDILKAMGLARHDVYLTNMVKNRPAMAKQATNNRKPTAAEMEAWLPFLKAELDVIRPVCVVALGEAAAEGLLGVTASIPALRGKWHDFAGVPVRVTYHPSYLLRTEGLLEPKRQLWEDMLVVMERLGMPINDKQRGYFLPKG
jgi:DNA polymerase